MSVLDQAAADTAPLMQAVWRALTNNERPVVRALAVLTTPLYSEETAAAVGIRSSSIGKALESLLANADVINEGDKPRPTDPMFELWLRTRGLTPAAGDDDRSSRHWSQRDRPSWGADHRRSSGTPKPLDLGAFESLEAFCF